MTMPVPGQEEAGFWKLVPSLRVTTLSTTSVTVVMVTPVCGWDGVVTHTTA
jgi:hypothetical protein